MIGRMRALGVCAALGMVALPANATILYSANFNAPTFSDVALVGQDGWVAHSGAGTNSQFVVGSATNGNVTLTTNGEDTHRNWATAVTSGSIYLSADFTVNSAQTTGDYFIHLGDGGTSLFYDRVYVRSASGGFQMALATSTGTPTYGATVLNIGQTYHLVAKYDFVAGAGNDSASLYINPTDSIFGGDNLYTAGTTVGTDAASMLAVYLRQGSSSAAPNVTVDNIAVAIPDVPEPASLGLLALGSILFIRRRRA